MSRIAPCPRSAGDAGICPGKEVWKIASVPFQRCTGSGSAWPPNCDGCHHFRAQASLPRHAPHGGVGSACRPRHRTNGCHHLVWWGVVCGGPPQFTIWLPLIRHFCSAISRNVLAGKPMAPTSTHWVDLAKFQGFGVVSPEGEIKGLATHRRHGRGLLAPVCPLGRHDKSPEDLPVL
jgi:hypothetical protein